MNRKFIYGMLGIFSLFSSTESEDIIHVDELSTLQVSRPGAMSERKTNIQTITVPDIPLTAANLINQLRVHVNWRFCKNAVKGDEVYSYEYVNP